MGCITPTEQRSRYHQHGFWNSTAPRTRSQFYFCRRLVSVLSLLGDKEINRHSRGQKRGFLVLHGRLRSKAHLAYMGLYIRFLYPIWGLWTLTTKSGIRAIGTKFVSSFLNFVG